MRTKSRRVSKAVPRPLCAKPDLCGWVGDNVLCMRSCDAPPGWHRLKSCKAGETLFVPPNSNSSPQESASTDWVEKTRQFEVELTMDRGDRRALGLTPLPQKRSGNEN